MEPAQTPMIDPFVELIVMIIKNTEYDSNMWVDEAQRGLATEIAEAIERRFNITVID